MDLLKKLSIKKTNLQDEIEDKNFEVERLKINLISQGESSKYQEELEETRKAYVEMKNQLEEAKRIEEVLKDKLDEKEEQCKKLEMEVVGLRKTSEKSNVCVKFRNNSIILDEILDCQRSPFD